MSLIVDIIINLVPAAGAGFFAYKIAPSRAKAVIRRKIHPPKEVVQLICTMLIDENHPWIDSKHHYYAMVSPTGAFIQSAERGRPWNLSIGLNSQPDGDLSATLTEDERLLIINAVELRANNTKLKLRKKAQERVNGDIQKFAQKVIDYEQKTSK